MPTTERLRLFVPPGNRFGLPIGGYEVVEHRALHWRQHAIVPARGVILAGDPEFFALRLACAHDVRSAFDRLYQHFGLTRSRT